MTPEEKVELAELLQLCATRGPVLGFEHPDGTITGDAAGTVPYVEHAGAEVFTIRFVRPDPDNGRH
jgi:hypothetical protein